MQLRYISLTFGLTSWVGWDPWRARRGCARRNPRYHIVPVYTFELPGNQIQIITLKWKKIVAKEKFLFSRGHSVPVHALIYYLSDRNNYENKLKVKVLFSSRNKKKLGKPIILHLIVYDIHVIYQYFSYKQNHAIIQLGVFNEFGTSPFFVSIR